MKVLVINFGTPSTIFFFALIKKIFLQTLVEIIFRYHKFFLGFWDPLGPPYEQNKIFLHVRSWVSKWCKKGALTERIFGKYSKMKVLVLNFGTPSTNLFFALIKKIFLQTLIEIIFRYHSFFYCSFGTPGPPYEHNEFFLHMRCWVSK